MDVTLIITIVFGLIGILGIAYTVYNGRKSLRKKFLIYENSFSIPLAQAFSPEADYKLSVLYKRKGYSEEKIVSVYTTFLKFANIGKEPIRGSDIAPANPIKVKIEGARTLDIQIAGTTREVNKVTLRNQEKKELNASAELYFDFLDYQDGALIKILTVGDEGEITMTGDIIGMPEGIKKVENTDRANPIDKNIGWIILGITIVCLTLSAFLYKWISGYWDNFWLIFIPVGSLVFFIIVLAIISSNWSWPKKSSYFPASLDLPKWCRSLPFYISSIISDELEDMKPEGKTNKKKQNNTTITNEGKKANKINEQKTN